MSQSNAIEVLKTKNINDGEIKTKEINFNTGFREIINICDYNINYLLKESSKKAIWKFNHMRSEIRYWEGIKELANQRKEALLALEQKEKYFVKWNSDIENAQKIKNLKEWLEKEIDEDKYIKLVDEFGSDDGRSIDCFYKNYFYKRFLNKIKSGLVSKNEIRCFC